MSDKEMGIVLRDLQQAIIIMKEHIETKNMQLFNAFSIARPDLFKKEPRHDEEFLNGLHREFYKFLEELEEMGKHEFMFITG